MKPVVFQMKSHSGDRISISVGGDLFSLLAVDQGGSKAARKYLRVKLTELGHYDSETVNRLALHTICKPNLLEHVGSSGEVQLDIEDM